MAAHLRCFNCGEEYPLNELIWRCSCGGLLDIVELEAFQRERINPSLRGLWKYAGNLPVRLSDAVSFGEGETPLLSMNLEGHKIWVKQDQLFSTGSYKDRGASILISHARSLGIRHVVEDSSGNAGCAIAAYCANAGISCDIYVPEHTSPAKLAQIQWYGAKLVKVPGSREDTAYAVMEAAQKNYYASHSWNPFFFQGTKTFAYEVCEQLGWQAPDWVVLPAGNGTLLLGAEIGFRELMESGVIQKLPRICAVQAENCSPLADAFFHDRRDIEDVEHSETLAEGIAIARPVRAVQILQAVRSSQGRFQTVSETEITEALIEMGLRGFFIEPTAAATMAGVKKLMIDIPEDALVLTVFTGHGLKTTEKFLKVSRG